jgi:hypothetical protein
MSLEVIENIDRPSSYPFAILGKTLGRSIIRKAQRPKRKSIGFNAVSQKRPKKSQQRNEPNQKS